MHPNNKTRRAITLVVESFPKGRNVSWQSLRQIELLHDRCRLHLSPPPQFIYGTGGEGNILQPSAPVVSAATAHKTFGPHDLRSTYVSNRRVFGGIGHRYQALWAAV
ncbi:uncharacterized protein TNCV_3821461 [Trichonephila clavipes]|nr:uncharacterized protein TNCV_3821461 [Trichonephila clavipes]